MQLIIYSLTTAAPGHLERPKNEEPSPLTAAEGQGEPFTQGSLKAAVMGDGHPSQGPGPSTDHNVPQTSKSHRHRARKKTFSAKVVQAASSPDTLREE